MASTAWPQLLQAYDALVNIPGSSSLCLGAPSETTFSGNPACRRDIPGCTRKKTIQGRSQVKIDAATSLQKRSFMLVPACCTSSQSEAKGLSSSIRGPPASLSQQNVHREEGPLQGDVGISVGVSVFASLEASSGSILDAHHQNLCGGHQ